MRNKNEELELEKDELRKKVSREHTQMDMERRSN